MPTLLIALFALLSASGPTVVERLERYDVAGGTAAELRASIQQNGPIGEDGKRHDAMTSWSSAWRYRPTRTQAGCAAAALETRVEIVVTLPRWSTRQVGTYLSELWDRYIAALDRHEQGHVDLAQRAVATVHQRLSRLTAPTCPQLDELINSTGRAMLAEMEKEQAEFDRATKHGSADGVQLR